MPWRSSEFYMARRMALRAATAPAENDGQLVLDPHCAKGLIERNPQLRVDRQDGLP
jgi:hypothetical protein